MGGVVLAGVGGWLLLTALSHRTTVVAVGTAIAVAAAATVALNSLP